MSIRTLPVEEVRNIVGHGMWLCCQCGIRMEKHAVLTATGRLDWASQLVSNGKTPVIPYPSIGHWAFIQMVEITGDLFRS